MLKSAFSAQLTSIGGTRSCVLLIVRSPHGYLLLTLSVQKAFDDREKERDKDRDREREQRRQQRIADEKKREEESKRREEERLKRRAEEKEREKRKEEERLKERYSLLFLINLLFNVGSQLNFLNFRVF